MRGILFTVAAVIVVLAAILGGNPALAGAGILGPGPWALWALALVALVLAPDRGLTEQEEIETSFAAAAAEEANEVLESWPIWEGYVPLELAALAEPPVGLVSEGVEIETGLLKARQVASGSVLTARQKLAIAQQRALRAELARKGLTSAEVFDLGIALAQARKGLLAV